MSSVKKSVKRPLPPKPSPKEPEEEELLEEEVDDDVEDGDDEEEEEDFKEKTEGEEDSTKAPRKKATMADHIDHYNQLFALLDAEIDRKSRRKENGTRPLRTIRKVLTQMRKEVPRVTRSKEARKQSSTKAKSISGLQMVFPISEELSTFLQVPPDTKLSRLDITRAICVYANLKEDEKREEVLRWKYLNPGGKRDLQFPQDKKAIIPDKALSKLLRYDEYKKQVSSGKITQKIKNKETGNKETVKVKTEALYYWAIQRLIGVHILNEDSSEPDSTEDE